MNELQPLVSVLMTAYNREKYIGAAIESVLASTYNNFELIITDDQSKDKTVEIAQNYTAIDSRVKVFINEKNIGDYPNRNRAASYAQGKYLKYVDADDYIYPWGLQLLMQMMEEFPDAGWGLCSLDQDVQKHFPIQLSPIEAYKYHYSGPGLFHKAPLSSIIRKDVFEQIKGFPEIRMAGDFDMWHKLAQKFSVLLMPQGIVWYREHEEQEMTSYRKYIKTYADIEIKYLLNSDCPLPKNDTQKILKNSRRKAKNEIAKGVVTLNMPRVKDNLIRLKAFNNAS